LHEAKFVFIVNTTKEYEVVNTDVLYKCKAILIRYFPKAKATIKAFELSTRRLQYNIRILVCITL